MTTLAYTHLYTKEEELATLRTQNAELLRKLQRKIRPVQQLAPTLSTWKPGSLHAMSSDAPSFTESKDILRVRKFTLDWPGYYSFVLRLGKEERQMITSKEIVNHEKRHQEFRDTYTTPSIHQLQHDIYMALKRLLGKSIMVSNLFYQVTTETQRERVCCLLVLNLVSSTLPCIRRPRPDL